MSGNKINITLKCYSCGYSGFTINIVSEKVVCKRCFKDQHMIKISFEKIVYNIIGAIKTFNEKNQVPASKILLGRNQRAILGQEPVNPYFPEETTYKFIPMSEETISINNVLYHIVKVDEEHYLEVA